MKKVIKILSLILLTSCLSGCNEVDEKPHEHSFTNENINSNFLFKEATCTEPAKYYYSCECGEKGSSYFEYGESNGHSFTKYHPDGNATHLKDGTKTAICDHCSETNTITDENSKLKDHNFVLKIVNADTLAKEATCTEPAKYYYSCECGELSSETFNQGEPNGHSFTNYISDHNATHMEDGTKTAKCDFCQQHETVRDVGSRLTEHSFDMEVPHNKYLYSDATCTEPAKYYYSCECGEKGSMLFEYGEALGHKFGEYISDHNATHMEDGTKTAKCERCEETNTILDDGSKIKEHDFSKKIVATEFICSEATCTEPAKYYYSCECGEKCDSTFEHGEPNGHSFTNYVSDHNATHMADGTKTAKCDFCEAIDTIIDDGSKTTKHTFNLKQINEKYLRTEATCKSAATYFYSCECGEKGTSYFSEGTALGHSFTNYISNDDATCYHDGTKTAKCDRCSQTDTINDDDSKKPHVFDKKIQTSSNLASEGDCQHKKTYYYACSVCYSKNIYTFGTETFEGDSYGSHEGGTATCTKLAICELCGKSYGNTLSHTGGTATCSAKAICEVCGQSYGDFIDHTFEEGSDHCKYCDQKKFDDIFNYYDLGALGIKLLGARSSKLLELCDNNGEIKELRLPEFYHGKSIHYLDNLLYYAYGELHNKVTIKKLILPSSYTHVSQSDFKVSTSNIKVESIYYEGTIEDWCEIKYGKLSNNNSFSAAYEGILQHIDNLYVNGKLVEDVIINKKISVQNYSFQGYKKLKSFIANEEISLGTEVFSGSTVKEIYIPEFYGYNHINAYSHYDYSNVFAGAYCLEKLTWPSFPSQYDNSFSVYSYGFGSAFGVGDADSSYFYSVDQPVLRYEYTSFPKTLTTYATRTYDVPKSLKEIVFVKGSSIWVSFLENFTSLTKITFEGNIYPHYSFSNYGEYYLGIQENAFKNCKNVTEINIYFANDSGYHSIDCGKDAFYGCSKATINMYFKSFKEAIDSSTWNPGNRPINFITSY